MYPKYEEDFYGWAMASAQLLKERKVSEIDFDNLIEEIESMGRREKNELFNLLSTLIAHLLKLRCAYPKSRERNQVKWIITIKRQRNAIKKQLKENPSLKSMVDADFLLEAYQDAVLSVKVANEQYGDLDVNLTPEECPYTLEQCLDEDFYPEKI